MKRGISRPLELQLLKGCLEAAATPGRSRYIYVEALAGMEKKDSDHVDIAIMWWGEKTVFAVRIACWKTNTRFEAFCKSFIAGVR